MIHRTTVIFRGEELDVEVFSYRVDSEVNAVELEWDFVGLTEEGRRMLKITSAEEAKIEEHLVQVMEDHYADYYDSYGV